MWRAADPTEIKGVLRLNGAGDGVEFTAAPGPVPTGGELVADPAATGYGHVHVNPA